LQPSVAAKVVAEFARLTRKKVEPAHCFAEPLSERELEILRLIAQGASNREIAGRLFLAEGTVKNHVTNILGKLDVRDRTQAAIKAKDAGLIN
jgi:DNA-binding NarL/FixJ family response regulator